jgi:hypothetical protein
MSVTITLKDRIMWLAGIIEGEGTIGVAKGSMHYQREYK